jgi:hypothetical protein
LDNNYQLTDNFPSAIKYNLARNALKHLCSQFDSHEILCPNFTCSSVHQALSTFKYKRYSLDANYLPALDFVKKDQIIIINNYFGSNFSHIKEWINEKNISPCHVIIDNSHSLDFNIQKFNNYNCIYSLRKFMGVTDGSLLYVNKDLKEKLLNEYERLDYDTSSNRIRWLFEPLERSRNETYNDYLLYRKELQSLEVKKMSSSTQFLLNLLSLKTLFDSKRSQLFRSIEVLKKTSISERIFKINYKSLPIGIPVFCDNPIAKQKLLATNKIYSVVYWPECAIDNSLTKSETFLFNHLILPANFYEIEESQLTFFLKVMS